MMPTEKQRKPRKAKTAEVAERRRKLIELRAKGTTWRDCADQLGYAGPAAACKDIERAIRIRRNDLALAAADYREIEIEKLDLYERIAFEVLETKHFVFDRGVLVKADPDEEGRARPVLDDGPKLAALDRLLKIQARRAKLLDLDLAGNREQGSGQVVRVVIGGVDHSAITG
jgi:hypothetical protein